MIEEHRTFDSNSAVEHMNNDIWLKGSIAHNSQKTKLKL